MTKEPEETEYIEDDEDDDYTDPVDDIRRLIRDEIQAVLKNLPGQESASNIRRQLPDEDEPLTLRALEASVRSIVEDAMIPLREAQTKPKPKPKTKPPETEPEPPQTKVSRSKLTSFLWGDE
jgi:hypothetical protein